MKWIGQHIYDLVAKFRGDVYLENISSGTIASGGNLGLDSNNKIVKQSDAGITDLHGAGVDGSANQLLTDDGDGTVTSESSLTYDSEMLIIGDDDDGNATIKRFRHTDDDGGGLLVRGGDATGSNKDGGNLGLYGGRGTGSGSGGHIYIYTSAAGSSGSSLNPVTTVAAFFNTGNTQLYGNLIFEGGTPDAYEQTLTVADPTSDETITIPNQTGTMLLSGVNTLDDLTFTSATSQKPLVSIKNTTNDANGSILRFVKDKGAAGADDDIIGDIEFYGDDAGQNQTRFGLIRGSISTAADGSEGGQILIGVATHDGEMRSGLTITDGDAEDEIDVTIGREATSLTTIAGSLTVTSDLTVSGTTTTLNTATLNVEDKNIVLNYAAGDTSSTADGAGITIQDAIDASNDATILWSQSNKRFDFSHAISLTNGSATARPALSIDHDDVDVIAVDINADNTTGNIIDIDAQALTHGDAIFIDSNSLGGGSLIDLDVDDAYTASPVIVVSGQPQTKLINIDYDKAGVIGDGAERSVNALDIDMTDAATNHANGIVELTGIDIAIDAASAQGMIKQRGVKVTLTDGDVSQTGSVGFWSITEDGGMDFLAQSSADEGDYFAIQTTTHGATTLTTVDDDAAAAHFEVAADGNITLDAAGTIELEAATNLTGALTVGVDDTGHDVKFFGATSGRYMLWDESDDALELTDSTQLKIGAGADLRLYHDGSDSYVRGYNTDLIIMQDTADKDITFKADNGAGGTATYFSLDGSAATHDGSATTGLYTYFPDNSVLALGSSKDFTMYHNGSTTYLNNKVGNLDIRCSTDDGDIILKCDDGSGGTTAYITLDGSAANTVVHTDFLIASQKKLRDSSNSNKYIELSDSSANVVYSAYAKHVWRTYNGSSYGDRMSITNTGELEAPRRKFAKTSNTDGDHDGDVVYFGGEQHTIAEGQIVHYRSNGNWELADANSAATCDGLLGVALGGDADVDGVLLRGMVTLDHDPGNLGDVLFVSAAATGQATGTAPSGNGDIVRVIGYCIDASNGQIWFNPDGTFVEVNA